MKDKVFNLTQEPVAYLCRLDEHSLFDLPTPYKACEDCFPVYAAPPQPAQEPVATLFGTLPIYDNTPLQPAQEPVCPACKAEVLYECVACSNNNYPPQRPWVGLTDEEIIEIHSAAEGQSVGVATGLTERKLKEKNT